LESQTNRAQCYDITKEILAGKTMRKFGKRRRKDGTLVDVEILGEPIEINGKLIGALGLYRDITIEIIAKEKLQASEERFRRMFQDSPVALQLEDFSKIKQWVLKTQEKSGLGIREFFEEHSDEFSTMSKLGKIISLNAASLFLFHAKDKADLQANLYSIVSSESRNEQIDIICSLLDGETTLEKEMIYKSMDGGKIYAIVKLSILPGSEESWDRILFSKSMDGGKIYAIVKLSILPGSEESWDRILFSNMDITKRKLAEEQLSYISLHDMMTGLYNRAFFEEEMERTEKSRLRPISILIGDMDNLKKINDLHGHRAGDIALQHIASILKICFRPEDVIARVGGDEFSVLLPGISADLVKQAKQRVLDQIALHNRSNSEDLRLSISIGCGTANKGDLLTDVFKLADERMYQEKQKNKKGSK
jgi:diguanylate cyclase (GGDEF)-like protein